MKNKKLIVSVAVLALVIAVMAGVYLTTRPEAQAGTKDVGIVIVYEDGSVRSEMYRTDAEYLSQLLLEKELVTGYESEEYGFTIEAVDGITLDWSKDGAYWALYVGKEDPETHEIVYEYATASAAGIVLEQGGMYKLAYEKF